jgi:predicted metalloprotease
MASPSRSSSSRGRASARSSSSSGGNQQVMVLGAIAVVVVIVVFVMMSGGGKPADKPAAGGQTPAAAAPKSTPAPAVSSSAKSGKTPAKPAPALTAETLEKVRSEYAKMKTYYNEGSTARTAGDNQKAREQQALAKTVLDGIDAMIEPPLRWQEEAEMEGWAQPAEYVELAKLYNDVMTLAKKVRMGGGK